MATSQELKKFECIENTIDIWVWNLQIRLWINKGIVDDNYQEEVRISNDVVGFVYASAVFNRTLFFSWVSAIPNLNAVQVIYHEKEQWYVHSKVKYGTVVYTVPFAEVHG